MKVFDENGQLLTRTTTPFDTWEKIYENVLTVAAATVAISGLAGDTDWIYKLYIMHMNTTGTASGGIRIQYNADAGTNYNNVYVQALSDVVSSGHGEADVHNFLGYTYLGQSSFNAYQIWAKSGVKRRSIGQSVAWYALAGSLQVIRQEWFGEWTNTADNLTQINLSLPANMVFDVGTNLIIYKRQV